MHFTKNTTGLFLGLSILFFAPSCKKEAPVVPGDKEFTNSGRPVSQINQSPYSTDLRFAYNEEDRLDSIVQYQNQNMVEYTNERISRIYSEMNGYRSRDLWVTYDHNVMTTAFLISNGNISDTTIYDIIVDTAASRYIFQETNGDRSMEVGFDPEQNISALSLKYNSTTGEFLEIEYNTDAPGAFKNANLTIEDKAILTLYFFQGFYYGYGELANFYLFSSDRLESINIQTSYTPDVQEYKLYSNFDLDGYPATADLFLESSKYLSLYFVY